MTAPAGGVRSYRVGTGIQGSAETLIYSGTLQQVISRHLTIAEAFAERRSCPVFGALILMYILLTLFKAQQIH